MKDRDYWGVGVMPKPGEPTAGSQEMFDEAVKQKTEEILAAKEAERAKNAARPVDYDFDLACEICTQVAEGKSLKTIVSENYDMPNVPTILRWLHGGGHPEFLAMFQTAKLDQAESGFERLLEIVDNIEKRKIRATDAKVMIDTIKWTIGKLNPRYGEKIQVETDTKVIIEIANFRVSKAIENKVQKMISAPDDVIDVTPEKIS
jgi:hypothetical protein